MAGATGEHISNGKYAKQSSTSSIYDASRALNKSYVSSGSLTKFASPSWWEVDLRGYFTISSITLTAATYGRWNVHMRNAFVEVMDKDVSLCSDVQSEWCGNVSSTVTAGEEFTFTCNATFPVRFVRVTRPSTTNVHLVIGHVDVQGEGAKKPYRSYYKPLKNKKVSQPFLTTSAMTAGDCGIICHRYNSCIDFSYSAVSPTNENCLLSDKVLSSSEDNFWTTYTSFCM
ncbi:fucolectin-like [Haliotis rufescens]|uniref:fucolectin-like n=1 Tax=Haliotis rufescens TaxID=6454 RepID=UPI00201F1BA6|nr:fucolectin-like [Haliotis rufescens]